MSPQYFDEGFATEKCNVPSLLIFLARGCLLEALSGGPDFADLKTAHLGVHDL
jgi:hypothetical protein